MHVDSHSIVPVAVNSGGDHDQSILADEIPYASLRVPAVRRERLEVELEGLCAGSQQQQTAEKGSCPYHGC